MASKRPRASSLSVPHKRTRGAGPPQTIVFGTPLPPDEDDDSYSVPVWKQTVTDDRGRRRLHGAFTGGFSAGYFNTVGSKEGWTPKAFVSSRSNRNKDLAQRAEDFMDEEDRAEAAESRELQAAQSSATTLRDGQSEHDTLVRLFTLEEESPGFKIAQKMGWRPGQGIGPLVKRAAQVGDGHDPSGTKHLFAPKDCCMVIATDVPHDGKGLGYQSEARLGAAAEEADTRPMLTLPFLGDSKPKPIKKSLGKKISFGVGVLNDTGSDDEDPYELGPKIIPKRTLGKDKKTSFGVGVLNDTGSDDEDPYELGPKITPKRTLGKDKKTQKPGKVAKGVSEEKQAFPEEKQGFMTTHDGRPVLRDFVPAGVYWPIRNRYQPLQIPAGWKSTKSPISDASTQEYLSVADAAKASTLDAKARSSLLGEKPLPGKSVFDFIPKEARDRLAALTGKASIASRFTSSSSTQQGNQASAASMAKPEDPAEQAAKLGMYGAMTRSRFPFYPSHLLCKRFNIKVPATDM